MTENNNDKKTAKKTLTLKRPGIETSTVKQNFSHGRTKAVVVETKRRKITRPDETANVKHVVAKPRVVQAAKPRIETPPAATSQQPHSNLSSAEMEARMRALEEARLHAEEEHRREEEEHRRAEEEAKRRKAEEAKRAKEHEELLRKQSEKLANDSAAQTAEQTATHKVEVRKVEAHKSKDSHRNKTGKQAANRPIEIDVAPVTKQRAAAPSTKRNIVDDDEDEHRSRRGGGNKSEVRAPKAVKGGDERRRSKLTLNSALDEDGNSRGRSMAAMRRRQEKFKRSQIQEPREKISREVTIPETITIQELAQRMTERSVDVIKYLMKQGQMMKPGDVIDADMAQLIAEEFGHTVKRVAESDVEEGLFNVPDDPAKLKPRPPVVTIMGHVDHGKTSLLDAIRNANVVAGEAGGITQHIGAYQVEQKGQKITFIDTPGHAAFTAMRARGAQVTDIAVLVVAADDSVMPQTIESIHHAKAAGVPIIVAINKIDKPAADPQKVRTELLQHEVFVESMGGDTLEVEVSAKTGKNIDKLLEAILLQAEILDLKADPDRTAEGVVIEAQLDRGRGAVATVLIQKGTLHPSDIIVAGDEWGRVRALINDRGEHIKAAMPSMPVEVLGMQGTPQAGDRFAVVANEAQAREIAEYRQRLARDKAVARQAGSRGSLEQMMNRMQTSGMKEFPLVIKADVQGSVEAITSALEKLGNDEVRAHIVHAAPGGITESDVSLAAASNAAIIGFNVRANSQARDAAEAQGIEIRYYNIIYDLVDDVKAAMSGMLTPERRETFLGNAEIIEVFNISKIGKVAGCRVTEGKMERGEGVRLIRDHVVVHEGKLKTLKRFKDEVAEVPAGQECGMAFENYEDIRVGDIIEAFRVETIKRSL
ncbi:translation initiation factor IF-2 [uncultured Bartonella sp.]|uniref:translation initiation factor IF-2 n=1 Tax=uncultured Bartonella sp. TaxID=104108 RepID=UPI0025F3ADF5|nr:translation initiation factor IF-2 [uncultured Bartonella sp.]